MLWLFGDTLVGTVDAAGALSSGWRMPNNSALVQSGTCFTPVLGGPPGAPAPLIPPSGTTFYWPAEGFVDTAAGPPVLRLGALAVHAAPCGFGWEVIGIRLFTLSLPDLRATVVALAAEAELPENEPRSGASLQVLVGCVVLRTAGQDVAVASGEIVALPAQRHGIRAEVDSALLLTVPIT